MEAWVTTVVEDKEVVKALILGRSLRRAITTRKLVVVASSSLSSRNRKVLGQYFDHVVIALDRQDLILQNDLVGPRDFALLHCLNLTLFRKMVYLEIGTLVVKNCDEIFELFDNGFMAHAVRSENIVNDDRKPVVDLSVIGFTPNAGVYRKLVETWTNFQDEQVAPFGAYMKDWLLNQANFKELDEAYNFYLRENHIATSEFSIANIPDHLVKISFPGTGILESAALTLWRSLEMEAIAFSENCLNCQNSEKEGSLLNSIAIVGISCRHARARNHSEFWDLLKDGRSGICPVPSNRWTKHHGCKAPNDLSPTPAGFLSEPIDEFDGKLFGISPKELEYLDPQQRLLLEETWNALENACIDPLSLRGSHTGVFTGAWMNNYKDILERNGSDEFFRMYMGNSFGAAAARLSFFLGLTGPSVSTESGCSSSLMALELGVQSLHRGETNLVLACGVNLLLTPFNKDTMSFVIAGDGKCKTFDESADGFGRAEGCGVLVLKRYADAINDGDNIWGLIRGVGCAQEGLSKSMGTPTKQVEALAMALALKDAGVHPAEVSFIETHGTGTPTGDPLEISAIAEVYGGEKRKTPLILGSVKTNVGHTESCSGITGIIKVLLSMKHEMIPKHLNLTRINPKIDLSGIPAVIPMENVPWPKVHGKPRLAGVSSFGITGTDGHLILQEAPEISSINKVKNELKDRSLHLLKVSAKTEIALDMMLERYKKSISQPNCGTIADICFTANTGRASSLPHRAVLLVKDSLECVKNLQNGNYLKGKVSESTFSEKICFLFPGQGTQFKGMAQELYESSPVFRMNFDRCVKILLSKYGLDVKKAIWGTEANEQLKQTLYSQTSIFCVQFALLKLWESWGIIPDFVLGHSLGEFCAAVAANILTLEEALSLVAERSRMVESLQKGSMVVVRAPMEKVKELLGKAEAQLDIAAVNSNEQTVLAGDIEAIQKISTYCSKNGNIKTHILESTHAFHSKMMDPILENYEKIVTSLKLKSMNRNHGVSKKEIRYVSGVYGRLLEEQEHDILRSSQYWVDHTREKVDFLGACRAIASEGCNYFLEIGTQPILSALLISNSDDTREMVCLPSLRRNEENWKTILNSLGKLYVNGWNVDWKGFDKLHSRSKLNTLPTYPFQRKKYWYDVNSDRQGVQHTRQSKLHPLLGSLLPTATGQKIFQNVIDVRKVEWVKHHVVGKRMIFPGAAFLETCISAGYCATEGLLDHWSRPSGPLSLERLQILKPLSMEETKPCHIQVVLEKFDNLGETKVKVFRRQHQDGEVPKWISHCEAYFTQILYPDKALKLKEDFVLAKLKESCQSNSLDINKMYEGLAHLGLNFGPNFQSLEKAWMCDKGMLAKTIVPGDFKDYILHPIIVDAMIQTGIFLHTGGSPPDKLVLPTGIKKFTWLQNEIDGHSKNFMIYSEFIEGEMISILYEENTGNIIAFLCGVEYAESSLEKLESHLESQEMNLPGLYKDVWKPESNQARFDLSIIFKETLFTPHDIHSTLQETERIKESEAAYENLVYGYILKTYQELGWNWNEVKVGDRFTRNRFMTILNIAPIHENLVHYHLTVLEREGIVKLSDFTIEVMKKPPSQSEINLLIQNTRKILETLSIGQNTDSIYESCHQNLGPILRGKISTDQIFFPKEKSELSVEQIYSDLYPHYGIPLKLAESLKMLMNPNEDKNFGRILRVLETGTGAGNFTEIMMNLLKDYDFQVEYTISSVSQPISEFAEKKFEEYKNCMKFKILNLNEDAKSQGFIPGYYDLVIGGDMLHSTNGIADSLRNVGQLLRPNGILCMAEPSRRNHMNFIFSLLELEGQHQSFLTEENWTIFCPKMSFDKTVCIPANSYIIAISRATSQEQIPQSSITFNSKGHWVIFANLEDVESRRVVQRQSLYRPTVTVSKSDNFRENTDGYFINVNNKEHIAKVLNSIGQKGGLIEGIIYLWGMSSSENGQDQGKISQPLLYLCQTLMTLKLQPFFKLLVVTKGLYCIGDNLCTNPSASTVWGIAKSCSNEMNFRVKMIDLCPDTELNEEDLFHEVWRNFDSSDDIRIAYRQGTRYVARLSTKANLAEKSLKLPQSDRFQLILPQSKSISDLKFGMLGKYTLKFDEVEVKVHAVALNFRDVFAVLKPDSQFDRINAVGSDFAGVVTKVGQHVTKWKIGDSVFGCNLEGSAIPSHVRIVEDAVIPIPEYFTFAEAATLPTVFATAYHSLITVCKIKEGDTVLIHTASGGVGLCAIQICKGLGAKVIATAGSPRKKAFLRRIGVQHVFHSRNTDYEKDILGVTGGQGVDIVLNSLTGPGFKEATLRVCGKNARFIEMSKLFIWKPEEVKELRPDVNYNIVDLSSVSGDIWSNILKAMEAFLNNGTIKPIPYVRFEGVQIREALKFLLKAKHIGKVVCIMPEVKVESGEYIHFTPCFNEMSTYMITGGLGGIGLEVCRWMVSQGAKNVVLVGRSLPTEVHSKVIKELQEQGKNIITRSVDIGDYKMCQDLMKSLENFPPLRGIMHAAGVMREGTLLNQTWDDFMYTFRPKVIGAWNLHKLTENLNLEHFILFSSVSSMLGSFGLSNYASANSYLDALAWYRTSLGLNTTSINYGLWKQENVGIGVGKELRGVSSFSIRKGISSLEAILKSHCTQITVVDMDIPVLLKLYPNAKGYLTDMISSVSSNQSSKEVTSAQYSGKFWEKVKLLNAEEKHKMIMDVLKRDIRQILKLDQEEPIDPNGNFQDLGLDSLMLIELKNNLQGLLGSRMTIANGVFADCNNIQLLTDYIVQQIETPSQSEINGVNSNPELSTGQIRTMIDADSTLPEGVTPPNTPKPLSSLRILFLTGVTGNLGPYILKELLQNYGQIEKIYCLIRKCSDPLQRLKKSVRLENDDYGKVHPVIGDLSLEKFGMKQEEWDKLSEEVDAVIHVAVLANHVETYGPNAVRTVNVLGTQRILEFCCNVRTKYLFHASSLVAVSSTDDYGCLSQDWPREDEHVGVTDLAYPVSKMICDKLLHQAVQRGLPAKSFRFGSLLGQSDTGRFNYQNNHFMLRFFCFMKVGAMPRVPFPAVFLPVDIVASTALKIFFHVEDTFHSDIFNLCHPIPPPEQEFPALAKEFGFHVEVAEYPDFLSRLANEGESSLLHPFKRLYESEEMYKSLTNTPDIFKKWLERPNTFFKVDKINSIIPNYAEQLQDTWDYLRRDLCYARDSGLFEKFKLAK